MTDPCRLFVVRHGTTRMNVENRYRGRRDVPLDAQGYQDAVDAARLLSPVRLTAVYAGPLRRTIATAHVIADEAGVAEVRTLDGLINLDYGAWEGKTPAEAAAYDPRAFELYRYRPLEAVCPGGESLLTAQARMLEAIRHIGASHPGETVTAVSHAVMVRLAIQGITGIQGEGWRVQVRRGSAIEFRVEDGDVTLQQTVAKEEADESEAAVGA